MKHNKPYKMLKPKPRVTTRAPICGLRELRGLTIFIAVCQILLYMAALVLLIGFFIWPSHMQRLFHIHELEPPMQPKQVNENADILSEDSIHRPPPSDVLPHYEHFHMPHYFAKINQLHKKSNDRLPQEAAEEHQDKSATSPRRTFHMIIFRFVIPMQKVQQQTGQLPMGKVQQQTGQDVIQYPFQPPIMEHKRHHRHVREAPTGRMDHHYAMQPHNQADTPKEESSGWWTFCKLRLRGQFHRRRLVPITLFTLVSLALSCSLFYGSYVRQPVLLLPYLGAQIIYFILSTVLMIHKFFHLADLHLSNATESNVIVRHYLFSLSHTLFTLGMLFHFLLELMILTVVWSFYYRLRASIVSGLSNASSSRHHRRSVSDSVVMLYDKVILEENEEAEEKKGEMDNLPRPENAPPAYVAEEMKEEEEPKNSSVILV